MKIRSLHLSLLIALLPLQILLAQSVEQQPLALRMQREAWWSRGRLAMGDFPAAMRLNAYQQKMLLRGARPEAVRTARTGRISSNAPWTPLGPAPLASDASGSGQQDYGWVSGRATSVVIDPADLTGNTVYAGAAYGGVWKSTNAGPLSPDPANVTWQPLTDDQPTLAVGTIAIQPQVSHDPNRSIILVGTGEADSSSDSYYGLGILRSANAGAFWTLIPSDVTGTHSFAGIAFSRIAFSTTDPSLAVAATAGASEGILEGLEYPPTANLGLYYSLDAGISWSYANVTDAGIAVVPGSATSVIHNGVAGTFLAALRYHGFYSSVDGVNWTRLATQPGNGLTSSACPPSISSSACPIYRGEIAIVPGRNEIYVWYVDVNDNDQGIWKSLDGGHSWMPIVDSGIQNCGDNYGCGTQQGTYNLELAAVANNTATDLYAGAVNLYKCTITVNAPDCSGSNTFINLTHAYGCPPNFGSIAHVHPAQHALSFLLLNKNKQDLMYFANDGGIYRALDGFTGLTTGTCGGSNSFDSLNQTLGSLTQVVSFAQPANDPNTLLGGTQGNGTAAAVSALLNSPWQSVNAGDSGFTEIDRNQPNLWYTSNPPDPVSGVNIYACPLGIACHTQDFQNNQVVTSATLGGDYGPYYPPLSLDPYQSSELLVGTCRLWRGPAQGGAYSALSHSFETGGDGICSGAETNQVRAIAAGGARDSNGFANVIYVGTDGLGPLIPASPSGGHLWVSTSVVAGRDSWVDRTASINPQGFPISSIAIDSSDTAGLIAYVGIMGFHVPHVWKTINAGITWTDFTANLPDAPVNAILVDAGTSPSNGTVYVGTDVGVFFSSAGSPFWTELGPPPRSGQSGFLPNVAVTRLRVFDNGTTRLLRASTYGRGIWQYPLLAQPDFVISMPVNSYTIFGGQQAEFDGKLVSLNQYSNPVNLSCTSAATPPPAVCSVSPNQLIPTAQGASLALTAAGEDGDYDFNLHAIGTDANATTHDSRLVLHVVDFGLTAPSPSRVAVNEPGNSVPVGFQVTASGSFSGTVTLSCFGLPGGASCSFTPSNTVNPISGHPVNVTLTISVATNTSTGTFPLIITGSTPGGPDQSQPLTLVVTNVADYTLTLDPISVTTSVEGLATFTGTLSSLNGYNFPVSLGCAPGATFPPPNCTPNPPSVVPTSNGAGFTVTAKSTLARRYSFNINATGTDPSSTSHSVAVQYTTTFDFAIAAISGQQSIPAGQSASYDLDLTPYGGNFPNDVSFVCSGLPTLSTCTFSPPKIPAGSADCPVALTVSTTAPILSQAHPPDGSLGRLSTWCTFVPVGLSVLTFRRKQRYRLLLPLGLLLICIACGGGSTSGGSSGSGQPGTQPGHYTVTIIATSGSLVRSTPVTLIVN